MQESKMVIYMQAKKQQLEPDMEILIGSKLGKEYDKAVYCHPVYLMYIGFPGGTSGKEPACLPSRHKRCRFDPWVRKIPGGGHGNSLQYSCLDNSMDKGAWQATVHGITKSWT